MSFIKKLYYIKEDLNLYKKDRNEIFKECIEARLNKVLYNYIQELEESRKFLELKKNVNIIKRL